MRPSELIEKYGWIQGRYGGPSSGFCASGAILYAGWSWGPTFREGGVAAWNDDPHRTKEEVINELKELEDKILSTETPAS